MNQLEKDYANNLLVYEGIDYGLNFFSDFTNITDSTFHELLRDYRNNRQAVLDYIEYG